jgi:hypothetical protein
LFVQHLLSGVARFRIRTERKKGRGKLHLYFGIVRLQFCGFLKQWVGLQDLSLIDIDNAQLAQRRRILWRKSQHVAILFLGLVVLLGGEIIVCAGEMLLLAILFLCASKAGDGRQG